MKHHIDRVILMGLIGIVFGIIFYFSHQPATNSQQTSMRITKKVIEAIPYTSNLSEMQKQKIEKTVHIIVRKLAHLSIYTVLGVLLMMLMNTYSLKLFYQLSSSIGIGFLYAISDEFHQHFIWRKKCRISRCTN